MMFPYRFKSRKIAVGLTVTVVVVMLGVCSFVFGRAHRGLTLAKSAIRAHQWSQARRHLDRYLWLYPKDSQARLLLAEGLVRDDELTVEEGVLPAIEQLRQIPPDADQYSEAKLREGRLRFLILRQPAAAERLFREALAGDPDLLDAHLLLWRLLDMTGRQAMTPPIFWRVFDLTPARDRAVKLRDWYLSEFHPGTSNAPFDVMMGFAAPNTLPGEDAVFKRLLEFRGQEPNAALTHAALADWFRLQGDPKHALFLIKQTPNPEQALHEPFFVATSIEILIDLGQFDEAEQRMSNWPEPRSGYSYWRCQGIVQDEVLRANEEAVAFHDKALETPPGKTDWPLMTRKAQCLVRLGKSQEAAAVREHSHVVEHLMETKVHQRLREVLANLEQPKPLGELVDFYRKLGRNREAEAWQSHIDDLHHSNPMLSIGR